MKNQNMQVKERPIIFSAEMVRAILDGKKTMTRRVVKPQPHKKCSQAWISPDNTLRFTRPTLSKDICHESDSVRNPYGKVGDRLWVRETWIQGYDDPLIESEGDDENAVSIIYKADSKELYRPCSAEVAEKWGYWGTDSDTVTWKSPIHMPRFASRILLEITDIRVERLQDISEVDCEKEGFKFLPHTRICFSPKKGDGDSNKYKKEFGKYWDTLNAKKGYSWASNPWVWVIEFKVIEGA